MNSKIIITPVETENEIQACTEIMAGSDPWKKLGMKYNDLVKTFRDRINETYVAKQNDSLLGFIVINMTGTFKGYVKLLAVTEASRGTGVGKLLLDFAEKKIFSQVPNVFICVSSFNKKAQEFYYKLGYRKIGEMDNFIIDGASEFILRKTRGPLIGYKPAGN